MTEIAVTPHVINRTISFSLAVGTGWPLKKAEECGPDMACYGILRGTGEAMHRADTFLYVDHGYFQRSSHKGDILNPAMAFNGYYRLVRDDVWHDCTPDDSSWDRFNALGLEVKDWRKSGGHIVFVPPSSYMENHLGLHGWTEYALAKLDECTDRPIITHTKASETPLQEALNDAWCLVTYHSNAAVDAILAGIPAIMVGRGLGKLTDVEDPPQTREFFAKLANSQFTLPEIEEGVPWRDT